MPEQEAARAAVFHEVGRPIQIESIPLVAPPPGHILARVRLATICGSDLHTISGRRKEAAPLVLGHEIVAEIAELGPGVETSATGQPLREGDRITFTVMASCGTCAKCRGGLPQKCDSLFKYGHTTLSEEPALSGGLAEYVYIRPGTSVYHVPDELPDALVCPANCALATVINALEVLRPRPDSRVLVQGAGLLGLYAIALLRELGVGEIVASDISRVRLAKSKDFGVDRLLHLEHSDEDDIMNTFKGEQFDRVLEVCGDPRAVRPGVASLSLSGRYVIVGLVSAGSCFTLDGNTIARNYLTIKGIHNYAPRHLIKGVNFLLRTIATYPYDSLVTEAFPLGNVQEAFELASRGAAMRVAVDPRL